MGHLFVILQYLLPHHLLSRLVALLANSRWALVKNPFIYLFMRHFKVDLGEALIQDYRQFETFNAFFTRQLLDNARPVADDDNVIVCPADGAVSQLGEIQDHLLFQAKGISYSAMDLLGGDQQEAETFRNGSFVTVYLSPRDYHRVHMPIAGTLRKTIYIPGRLFSVNRKTTERVRGLFTRNERLACFFETPAGPMAMVLVGAMIVAGIETVWAGHVCPNHHDDRTTDYSSKNPPVKLDKGAEMGRFKLGSTVILLFGPEAINLEKEVEADSTVKLGQEIARLRRPS